MLIGVLLAAALFATVYLIVDASAASTVNGNYVKLDLPAVDYVNWDEFFSAQGSFETVTVLPSISQNLSKVVGYHDKKDCSVQIFSGKVIFYTTTYMSEVTLDFMPLIPGGYTFRYVVNNLGPDPACSFHWRKNESDAWRKDPGDWKNPLFFTIEEGDAFQIKLLSTNERTHYYEIYFYITPSTVSTSGMTEKDIMKEPYFNQLGKVYHIGRDYYQIQDPDYTDYFNDYTVLKDLGNQLVTPDSDFYYYKIYKTAEDQWRILWRDQSALTNPLIYENGFFYVNEPAGAYYSADTYDSIMAAFVAMTSEKTKYKYDAIRQYKYAFDQDAIDFFDPQNNNLFWNVYVEDVFSAQFYQKFNPKHYVDLMYAYDTSDFEIEYCHWQLPSCFSFQNYTEKYDAIPIELRARMQRGYFDDIGSFIVGTYNSVSGWISTTATNFYCATEKCFIKVKSFFVDGKEVVVEKVESNWESVGNGAHSFVTEITTSSGNITTDIKNAVMEVIQESFGEGWVDMVISKFVGGEDSFQDLYALFRDKFYWISDLQAVVERVLDIFSPNTYARQRPPVIYANFEESESEYFQGMGEVAVVDFSWYARYKPYVDTFLSAILWGFFLFRLYMRLPDIINGVGSSFEAYSEDAPKSSGQYKFRF